MSINLKSISHQQWQENEKGLPVELSVIDISQVSVPELKASEESKYKESFTFYFDTGTSEIQLEYRWDLNGTKSFLFLYVHSDDDNPEQALESLLSGLGLSRELVIYVNEEALRGARFQAMRLDDNDNEVEITRFHNRSTAEFYVRKMEAKGHKQLYFIKED
ncbi:hypothetical protein [Agarilytica rhodophyticola]|uniref:hypothetical protein n=1 Tax=Agarilytica rhodophyticola TaxID=1737490 RepID=UPI000B34132C|nr:hypothetical protein [Agarilytica rhodophyticola]